MPPLIQYIERKASQFVSIEKVFREIAANLSKRYRADFQQLPFSSKFVFLLLNLICFRRTKADVYHITGHVHFMALRLPSDRTVLTIHDVRFLYAHSGLKRAILKKLYLDLPVKRLKFVTAISATVRDEIILHTGCDPRKIRVLGVPLLSHFKQSSRKRFNAAKPLLLQVGTMETKNISNLARALKGIECKLMIIGELNQDQVSALSENNVDVENVLSVSDEEIASFYCRADIVVFCSTYEGFGLPIIEAQAVGTPVVTSNISPMVETAGGGACLVDPFDMGSIRKGIKKVISDTGFRDQIVASGFKNVQRFRADLVAAQYEQLYDEILESDRV